MSKKRRKKGGSRKRNRRPQEKAATPPSKPLPDFRRAVVKDSNWLVHDEVTHKLNKNLRETARRGPQVEGYVCSTAWDYIDAHALAQMNLWAKEHRRYNVRTLYHGTKYGNLASVAHLSLRPGRRGMFGGGIYLTPHMTKALFFACGRVSGRSYILEVRANLGHCKLMKQADHGLSGASLEAEGYHSVEGRAGHTFTYPPSTLIHTEYVVYDPRQVCITGVFEYRAIPRE